jgi:hypothetical protein
MNERIKELEVEANAFANAIVFPNNYDDTACNWHRREEFNKKFAELIVLECERIAKNPKWYSESPSDGWRNPIRHVCNEMKANFGVK